MGRHDPIVNVTAEQVLIDRRTLARVTQRPIGTIRARCEVVAYHHDQRALYDFHAAREALAVTPPRGHRIVHLET